MHLINKAKNTLTCLSTLLNNTQKNWSYISTPGNVQSLKEKYIENVHLSHFRTIFLS